MDGLPPGVTASPAIVPSGASSAAILLYAAEDATPGSIASIHIIGTASIGSQLAISDRSPVDPYLEFSVHAGRTRTDIVARALKSALLPGTPEDVSAQVFRFRKLEVRTKPRVSVYADNLQVGQTPATITAEVSALKVLLPK